MIKCKKNIIMLAIILMGMVALSFVIAHLRDTYPLKRKIESAAYPGESGYSFNKEEKLRYTDLSLELRNKITKEQFESIETYMDAQLVFDTASQNIKSLPKDEVSRTRIAANIKINDKDYYVDQQPVIGYDWYIKPVVIQWHMDIKQF